MSVIHSSPWGTQRASEMLNNPGKEAYLKPWVNPAVKPLAEILASSSSKWLKVWMSLFSALYLKDKGINRISLIFVFSQISVLEEFCSLWKYLFWIKIKAAPHCVLLYLSVGHGWVMQSPIPWLQQHHFLCPDLDKGKKKMLSFQQNPVYICCDMV